jgi:hypothetical protein
MLKYECGEGSTINDQRCHSLAVVVPSEMHFEMLWSFRLFFISHSFSSTIQVGPGGSFSHPMISCGESTTEKHLHIRTMAISDVNDHRYGIMLSNCTI